MCRKHWLPARPTARKSKIKDGQTDAIIRKETGVRAAGTAAADVVSRTRPGRKASQASPIHHFTVTAIFTDGWMLHRTR
jgi:hypothetical protein